MSEKTVSYTLDTLPSLTEERRKELAAMANLPDDQIDTSDIPVLNEEFWAQAKVTPPRIKPNVSLRLPPEVIAFFQAENPKDYTDRMAAVLSAYVQAQQPK